MNVKTATEELALYLSNITTVRQSSVPMDGLEKSILVGGHEA